ncbi:MAG: hypothetical protein QM769_09955 [Pseudoxanthomonas sp.]
MNANKHDDPRLQLAPASSRAKTWMFLLCVVLPLGITLVALIATALEVRQPDPKLNLVAGSWPLTWAASLGMVAVIVVPVWLGLSALMRRHALALDGSTLDVRSTFYHARVALADLDLEHARIVDLDEHTELRPGMKSNGYTLPGFKSGWFYRLRDRRKTFVAISDGRWKLWLPTRGKHDLLLEPRDPRALLDRLRELARETR